MGTGGEECEREEDADAEGGAVGMAQAAGTRVPRRRTEEGDRRGSSSSGVWREPR